MKKRGLKILVVVVMAVTMLAGCSGSSGGSSKAVNLTMTIWGSEEEKGIYQERLDVVKEKYPNISVELILVAGDYDQKVQTMIAGGTPPDIMMIAENYQAYADKNQIIPLDDLIKENGLKLSERYSDDISAIMKYNGKQYGLTDRAGAMVLFYNKDHFDQAGVSYPNGSWTQADLLEASKKLTIKEGNETTQWGYYPGSWWPQWMQLVYQNGGKLFDGDGKPTFDTPEVRDALSYLNDMTYVHGTSPTPAEIADLGNPGPDPLFAQGKISMETTGFWNINSLSNVEGINWDISPIWGETNAFFNGFTIIKDSKHQTEAFKVIEALTTIEGQLPIIEHKQDAPATKAALTHEKFINATYGGKQINMGAFSDSVIYEQPFNPKWNEMMKAIDDKLSVYFNNQATVEDTTKQIQTELERIYK